MDPIETQLNLLCDCLQKKEKALTEVLNITENQHTVLNSGMAADEAKSFFVQMNREKQVFIETILQCDNFFEGILKEIGPTLDVNPALYKTSILELQGLIKKVMDIDVKIRVCEDKNRVFVDKPTPVPRPARPTPIMQDSRRIIKAYEDTKKNYKG